nr:hypothetical protein [Tanacetum cinerariifolium]
MASMRELLRLVVLGLILSYSPLGLAPGLLVRGAFAYVPQKDERLGKPKFHTPGGHHKPVISKMKFRKGVLQRIKIKGGGKEWM